LFLLVVMVMVVVVMMVIIVMVVVVVAPFADGLRQLPTIWSRLPVLAAP